METISHPTWIEVDLSQFRRNLQIIRSHIGKALYCLPVKANAYGHGLLEMSQIALEEGVDCLGVSCLQEGLLLRKKGITKPILVFGAIHEDQIDDLIQHHLEFTISSRFKAELVAKKALKKCYVHLEVETGMQRTGVRPETALEVMQYLKHTPNIEVVGVYSHMASSDQPHDPIALKQIDLFSKMIEDPLFQNAKAHIANSGGVLFFPNSHLGMVRPGLLSYGYKPENAPASFQGIAPCFSLKSRVSYFKVVPANQGISYGHTYKTQKQTRVVTVPIGYGDGYRRALSNQGEVLIRGKRFKISGAICMDQFMVDIGDEEAYVGDEVVLIGKQGSEEISLNDVAKMCDTIPYEVLCLLNQRIARRYKS